MKGLTLIFPIRLAMEDDANIENAATIVVVKNMVPRTPSFRLNLVLKKNVCHAPGASPDAKESMAKRKHSLIRIDLLSLLI